MSKDTHTIVLNIAINLSKDAVSSVDVKENPEDVIAQADAPNFIPRDDGTFSVTIQWTVREIPKS